MLQERLRLFALDIAAHKPRPDQLAERLQLPVLADLKPAHAWKE
jgi:hypothetical protein